MALIRGRERGTGAAIFTASMADIVFLLIVFFDSLHAAKGTFYILS